MDFKFSKDSGSSQQDEAHGEKKNQSALLVLLLILVGGFTYLYFFTGVIKPQEAQKTVEAPVVEPQVVKIPLPAREGEPAKPDATAPEKAAAPAPVAVAAPATKPVAAPAKQAAATAAPAVVPAPSKPKSEPKKTEAAKPADKKPKPLPAAEVKSSKTAATKAGEKKPATEVKKPVAVVAEKKSGPAKGAVKKTSAVGQAKTEAVAKTKTAATGAWSLTVGNYILEESLAADMGRVRKAGFEPIVKPSIRKKTKMNRLFVSDFNDRTAAQSTLEKLKRHTSDAFVMEQGGRFAVYAGSYSQSESARSEKERLKGAGFSITIKHYDIEIPSQSLSVGPFNSKKAADAALAKLKSVGTRATFSQK